MPDETSDRIMSIHDEDIKMLKRAIYGGNGETGILSAVRSNSEALERIEEQLKWVTRAIVIVGLGILAKSLWDLLLSHGMSLL